jgi:hypothetical protein
MPLPVQAASILVKEASLGILNSAEVLKCISQKGMRKKLPSGGLIYQCIESEIIPVTSAVKSACLVSKFLKIDYHAEMMDIQDMKISTAFSKFGPDTIEAVRFLDLSFAPP